MFRYPASGKSRNLSLGRCKPYIVRDSDSTTKACDYILEPLGLLGCHVSLCLRPGMTELLVIEILIGVNPLAFVLMPVF